MKNMEIERKFKVKDQPRAVREGSCPSKQYIQGYLNTAPVVRVRREGDEYFLTYKGGGLMARSEYNLPLDEKSFQHLLEKCDGNIISKRRYFLPLGEYTVELDVFQEPFDGLVMAEVEFPDLEAAESFEAPQWLGEEVTMDPRYHNSYLSKYGRFW